MSILDKVQKAVRYTGGELNSVVKEKEGKIRFAFCFPDVYEVGMSHLGMKILYHQLNEREDTWVERVFAPWEDMEQQMRENGQKLYGLESGDDIDKFDFVGFTLQYEMCYTNILNMLELGGIALTSKNRGENVPFVCAGGPCAYNPEPLAEIIDFFLMGEGEEIWPQVLDEYKVWKASGENREEFLKRICKIEGIYVPEFYDVLYNDDGTIKQMSPKYDFVPKTVKKRIIKDMDNVYYPDKIIVPFMGIVHDRVMLELFRGCIRGCRFCQAGYIYRPVRERSAKRLLSLAEKLIESTGYEEISLTSLSSSDYTCLKELTDGLIEMTDKRNINLALPSLRIDNFSIDLMNKIQSVRKSSLTFAPEAGTQRLRDVINKNITEENLENSLKIAFNGGYTSIKLYFMIGLPTETAEDVKGIGELAHKALDIFKETATPQNFRRGRITVSASSFVPKPFTAFQWESQNTVPQLKEKQQLLKENIHSRMINYNWHESYVSVLEGVFSRGDRKLSKVLLRMHELGARFDAWDEYFSYDRWMQAFADQGIDPDFYTCRKRSFDEILPWDIVDIGVSKKFFINEAKKAYEEKTTPNCREKCAGCGMMKECGVAKGE